MFIKLYLFYLLISISPTGKIHLTEIELENAKGIQLGKTEKLMKEDTAFLDQIEQKYERGKIKKEFNCNKIYPSNYIWKKESLDRKNCKNTIAFENTNP